MELVNLSNEQAAMLASYLTAVVCALIVIAFICALSCLKHGKASDYVSYTPALLTSLGIFGTFAGIVVGLMAFDANNIDGSIEGLLNGLKTAFFTSLVGIILSILFKVLQTLGVVSSPRNIEEVSSATPEDILGAINQQGKSIKSLVSAIGGDSDGSILSQLKLLRGDINDNQKISINAQKEAVASLKNIDEQLIAQKESFNIFSDKLWVKMQDFADVLSKSATETVIEALKQVISDFNHNLTEQFGENFKQLNESVKELVVWQENYKVQISEMTELYKLGVSSITATEASVTAISNESKIIPETMTNLKDVMEVNQHQLSELENHLAAFKDIRDKAVEAVPEIRNQIDETVKTIAASVESANGHYKELLTESDKYIQSHISASNDLLDKFVSNSKEGVEKIGEKLVASASTVEKAITTGAEQFETQVKLTNESLQETTNEVSGNTVKIREELEHTVKELSINVRDLLDKFVSNSKEGVEKIGEKLAESASTVEKVITTGAEQFETQVKLTNESLQETTNEVSGNTVKIREELEHTVKELSMNVRDLLDKFVSNSKEGVEKIGEKLAESASTVEKAITTGAEQFETQVKLTNESLQETTNEVSGNTVKIREELEHTVKELSINVRDLLDKFVSNSKEGVEKIGEKLAESASTVEKAITTGAEQFETQVKLTNESLQETTNEVSGNTVKIREELEHTVKELSINVRDLLDKFVSNSKEGVEKIGEKLAESASTVEKVITTGAEQFETQVKLTNVSLQETSNEIGEKLVASASTVEKAITTGAEQFETQVKLTNESLQETTNEVSGNTVKIREELEHTVKELSLNVRDLLDKFVSNSKEGVEKIGEKLAESASTVEKVITTGAEQFATQVKLTNVSLKETSNEIGEKLVASASTVEKAITTGAEQFETQVKLTNESLQETTNEVSGNTVKIREELEHTVKELSINVRDMVNGLIEDSKMMAKTLTDANKTLTSDTANARDSVVQSIENMQKRLESSLEDVFASQTQHMTKVFSNIDAGLKDQVGKTGEAVEKQLGMIDQSLQQELNRVMTEMGKALGQISNQFVKDYTRLVSQMSSVVEAA